MEQLESGATRDVLWNAAQKEMVGVVCLWDADL